MTRWLNVLTNKLEVLKNICDIKKETAKQQRFLHIGMREKDKYGRTRRQEKKLAVHLPSILFDKT